MELKNKFKLNKNTDRTYTRELKNGSELNYLSYNIPDANECDNNDDITNEILEFANYKSKNMIKTKKFKKSKISVAIQFEFGKYISTTFVNAGEDVAFSEFEDYDDQEIEDYGSIKSFSILII